LFRSSSGSLGASMSTRSSKGPRWGSKTGSDSTSSGSTCVHQVLRIVRRWGHPYVAMGGWRHNSLPECVGLVGPRSGPGSGLGLRVRGQLARQHRLQHGQLLEQHGQVRRERGEVRREVGQVRQQDLEVGRRCELVEVRRDEVELEQQQLRVRQDALEVRCEALHVRPNDVHPREQRAWVRGVAAWVRGVAAVARVGLQAVHGTAWGCTPCTWT
jgi:hypothetical protein